MKKKIDNLIVKFKEFYKTTYGMLITMCWALLLICLIIKLLGGNWFELWWNNKNFVNFCNYVETKTWLKMSIACLIYLGSGYFIISSILEQKLNLKLILIFFPVMILKSILNWYLTIIPFILDMVILILIPIILTKKWKRVLLINVFVLLLQVISILLRNLSFDFNATNTLIENYLYQVDYYLMILLFYLYTFKRKENK